MELKNDLLDRLDSKAPSISLEEVRDRAAAAPRRSLGGMAIAISLVVVVALVVVLITVFDRPSEEVVAPTGATSVPMAPAVTPDDAEPAGKWTMLPVAPIDRRSNAGVVWTGTEFLTWGGFTDGPPNVATDGAAYNPETGEWRVLAESPLYGRHGHVMEMVNGEVVVFGGETAPIEGVGTGAIYNPDRDDWREMQTTARAVVGVGEQLGSAWTGDVLLVYSPTSLDPPEPMTRLMAYDPVEDAWSELAIPDGVPSYPIIDEAMAWTGDSWFMWRGAETTGETGGQLAEIGHMYDPESDAWDPISPAPIPLRYHHSTTWTGEEVVVFGGIDSGGENYADGAAYNPATNEWRVIPNASVEPRHLHHAVWTGSEMIVIGGYEGRDPVGRGIRSVAAYNPASDSWRTLPDLPPAVSSETTSAVFAPGHGLVLWGASGGFILDTETIENPPEELLDIEKALARSFERCVRNAGLPYWNDVIRVRGDAESGYEYADWQSDYPGGYSIEEENRQNRCLLDVLAAHGIRHNLP